MNIIHRDLKSANVFLSKDGSAKIGDMNVSKVARNGMNYTQTGTPCYASPEVWKDLPYTMKSDIWSLGCVLYEMLALKTPFIADNMDALYQKVITGQDQQVQRLYSYDVPVLLKMLLNTRSDQRPSCNDIIKLPFVQARIKILFPDLLSYRG